jgi:hypothetical protein
MRFKAEKGKPLTTIRKLAGTDAQEENILSNGEFFLTSCSL